MARGDYYESNGKIYRDEGFNLLGGGDTEVGEVKGRSFFDAIISGTDLSKEDIVDREGNNIGEIERDKGMIFPSDRQANFTHINSDARGNNTEVSGSFQTRINFVGEKRDYLAKNAESSLDAECSGGESSLEASVNDSSDFRDHTVSRTGHSVKSEEKYSLDIMHNVVSKGYNLCQLELMKRRYIETGENGATAASARIDEILSCRSGLRENYKLIQEASDAELLLCVDHDPNYDGAMARVKEISEILAKFGNQSKQTERGDPLWRWIKKTFFGWNK